MTPARFRRFLDRDQCCLATAISGDTLVPQHRVGGMGGNRPENPAAIIVLDSMINGLIESSPMYQQKAYRSGWKLRSGFDPLTTPVWHTLWGWRMLDDDFGFRPATQAEVVEFTSTWQQ